MTIVEYTLERFETRAGRRAQPATLDSPEEAGPQPMRGAATGSYEAGADWRARNDSDGGNPQTSALEPSQEKQRRDHERDRDQQEGNQPGREKHRPQHV